MLSAVKIRQRSY